ncbi:serine hydrolase domain-containing protein [Pseudalkalibacillus hwajinpoensis]|uniref:serine hydrolase domain-containing protein n=1 Tax=Guptibacillus hwajinpoensis TaxID=208199 RepID=UPI001CD7CE78|nr:serine hydrolase domain-containing protein [Pseudalkalibacillus hwajinpoensis]MCA0991964.1 beta-lactamase family protein [Pseudalkalibacillus hwajinpoensis]
MLFSQENVFDHLIKGVDFSGSIFVKQDEKEFKLSSGYANRVEERLNKVNTRFGIASGCKLFTAIGITQLVEKKQLSFKTKLSDCLNISFPHFDPNITIRQLLTHTSGIPDYFDEDIMADYEDLWKQTPMYLLRSLQDFLPLFQNGKMIASPGEAFHYNNAGYIILGLIIEQQTGMTFQHYIEENVFKPAHMNDSGYFSLDRLPQNTALGYIDEDDGSWRTNTYAIPVVGGSDGGAYVTAPDMVKLWGALIDFQLLNESLTKELLTTHVDVKEDVGYGYGVWINSRNRQVLKYHVMGYDPGVSFHSAYYPESGYKIAIPSNHGDGAFDVMKGFEKCFID